MRRFARKKDPPMKYAMPMKSRGRGRRLVTNAAPSGMDRLVPTYSSALYVV